MPTPTNKGDPEPRGQNTAAARGLLALPPQENAWLLEDPGGQTNPAVQGPLHSADPRRSAHPKRPAGQGIMTPPTQYAPLGQGAVALRVVTLGPTVYSPGSAGTGAPLPAGQYTSTPPQGRWVPEVDPTSQ